MPWYSYVFFILATLATLALFVGGTVNASKGNLAGVVQVILLTAFWGGLGLWTGGFLS